MQAVPEMPLVAEKDKLTWSELEAKVLAFNKEHNVTYAGSSKASMICRVVFNPTKSKWRKYQQKFDEEKGEYVDDPTRPITYTPAGCTYQFGNHDKYWDSSCCGSSLYGHSLDPNESDSMGIKLSDYLFDWDIDYCYIVSTNVPEVEQHS